MKKIFFCEENDIDKNEYIVKWIDDFRGLSIQRISGEIDPLLLKNIEAQYFHL